MPDLAPWQWALGAFCAFMIGVAKTGVPGVGTLIVPLMVLMVGDARQTAAWQVPMLLTGDVFAVLYWWRKAESRRLLSLLPWVVAGMILGAVALSLPEQVLRRIIGVLVLAMLGIHVRRRWKPAQDTPRHAAFYGTATGFASTVANSAGPVMNLYLLSKKLPKEQFVATGALFFFVVNSSKVPIYLWYGLFSRTSLTFNLWMIPMVVLGGGAGLMVLRKLRQSTFENLISGLTALTALLLFR